MFKIIKIVGYIFVWTVALQAAVTTIHIITTLFPEMLYLAYNLGILYAFYKVVITKAKGAQYVAKFKKIKRVIPQDTFENEEIITAAPVDTIENEEKPVVQTTTIQRN